MIVRTVNKGELATPEVIEAVPEVAGVYLCINLLCLHLSKTHRPLR